MATKTTADSALKEDYQPFIREQINNETYLLTYIEKNDRDIVTERTGGRRAVLSLHVSRNWGVGSRAEGGTLPTAGSQGYAEERVTLKNHYGVGTLSGPLINASSKDNWAFASAMDEETTRVADDCKRMSNRELWGTSNGVIAAAGGTTNSVTINLASTVSDVQFRQLEVGMPVDIGTVASPTLETSNNAITATGGTAGAYTITLTTAATTSTTDYIFLTGNGGSGNSQKETTGLQSIIDSTGALFNVDPATYPVWSSTENGNGGTNRALSENLMESVYDSIRIASGRDPNLIICHHGVRRAYVALMQSQKRFVNTVQLKGGYGSGLEFVAGGGSIPVVVDRDCPANSMFFINTKHLTEYIGSDWEFIDKDGSVLHWLGTTDSYSFVLRKELELACDARSPHGKLVDITHA